MKNNRLLWVVQSLLALLFLFAGVSKFVMSVEEMTQQMKMPGAFLHFIGACEILGGLGLILPGLLKMHRGLTPLAAIGLAIITAGATVTTLSMGPMALFPLTTCLLCVYVAWQRRNWR